MTGGAARGRAGGAALAAALLLTACDTPGPRSAGVSGSHPAPAAVPTSATASSPPSAAVSSSAATAAPAAPPPDRAGTVPPPARGAPAARPRATVPRTSGPDLSRRPQTRNPSARTTSATPEPKAARTPPSGGRATAPRAPQGAYIRIDDWSARITRGGQDEVDACRDAVQWAGPELGSEDGYELRTAVIVGHDHCGFDRFATLPVGATVEIGTPRGAWTYRVYAHHVTPGRGAPAAGLYWGDLTLQSCVGPDTGFSYLVRL
ncbi:hypothetical protein [Streptomyces sp. NPDC002328]|uniref:hypothetical protein n=1 Tax=Streptomyces sp. NPDC002328 TaxID=3364642 RepID=UPI0036CD035F